MCCLQVARTPIPKGFFEIEEYLISPFYLRSSSSFQVGGQFGESVFVLVGALLISVLFILDCKILIKHVPFLG